MEKLSDNEATDVFQERIDLKLSSKKAVELFRLKFQSTHFKEELKKIVNASWDSTSIDPTILVRFFISFFYFLVLFMNCHKRGVRFSKTFSEVCRLPFFKMFIFSFFLNLFSNLFSFGYYYRLKKNLCKILKMVYIQMLLLL